MRQLQLFSTPKFCLFFCLASAAFSQTVIQVGQGATTDTIRNEFQIAYQRSSFFSFIYGVPLTEVAAYGTGGFRQEFQDPAKTGLKSALVRPAVPDLTLGLNNAVRQVRSPIYQIYIQSSVGSGVAGYPNIDTDRFSVSTGGTQFLAGSYQTFDKNFAIFLWDSPPNDGGTDVQFNVADPIFTRWTTIGLSTIGPPYNNVTAASSRFGLKANYQIFANGAIYVHTSGAFSGRLIFVRPAAQALYTANQGPSGFLGLPLSDETILSDGRRRQSFEGGTMEYALDGVPVIKNAVASVSITGDNPRRLTAGQTVTLDVTLQTNAAETVTDRDVFWSTTNGKVATVVGTGPHVTVRAVGGGTALVTATSEGKTSLAITFFVASQCCALGEGAPTQAITQTFLDAAQRNRLTLRSPIATPVKRSGGGYTQEAIALPGGARVLIAKADSSPIAYLVSGVLLASSDALGGVTGALGYPRSDANVGGTQLFENGALAGSPIRYVGGAILARWTLLSRETGTLGPPLGEAASSFTFTGAPVSTQLFRSGAVFLYNGGPLNGKTFVTTGLIAAKYAELGLAAGAIGGPLTDEFLTVGASRQEFEGAFLEYSPGSAVRVIDKQRKPSLTVTPSSLLPGARYRVAVGGFAVNTRVRVTTGVGAAADSFDVVATNGAYVWESVVAANARSGAVALRATDLADAQSFVDGSYTVRTLADLKPSISKISGDSQSGAPATILAAPLRVALRDGAGNAISGVALNVVASPGASIVSSTPLTAADGSADIRVRLPAQAGIVLVTVDLSGQVVTFSARAAAQVPTDFPSITQAVDGAYANSTAPLAQKGSLVAAMAGVVRFYQQRGQVPTDNGLADTASLNNYLRAFCAVDANNVQVCDGFLDSSGDPQPNLFRVSNYSGGVLNLTFADPTLATIRDWAANGNPTIVGLQLFRNGQTVGVHFVTAFGVTAAGDLAIFDPNPQFGFTLLSQYLGGFPAAGAAWTAKPVAALVFIPTGASTNAFFATSATAFTLISSGTPCSTAVSWPSNFASTASSAAPGDFRLQACDGAAPAYQLAVPAADYLLQFTSLGNPVSRTTVGGAAATAYRVSRVGGDAWALTPEELSASPTDVLNAASFSTRLGAGGIVSVFGAGLPLAANATSSVQLDGLDVPIFFSNGFQLNTAVPSDTVAGQHTLRLRSSYGDLALPLDIGDVAPGLFLLDARRSAAVLNQDGSINSSSNPAVRGQAIVVFATGLGAVAPQSNGLSTTTRPVTAVLNGRELNPFFSGLTPGYIGLYQINVVVPAAVPPGIDQTLLLRINGVDSNAGFIAIR